MDVVSRKHEADEQETKSDESRPKDATRLREERLASLPLP